MAHVDRLGTVTILKRDGEGLGDDRDDPQSPSPQETPPPERESRDTRISGLGEFEPPQRSVVHGLTASLACHLCSLAPARRALDTALRTQQPAPPARLVPARTLGVRQLSTSRASAWQLT